MPRRPILNQTFEGGQADAQYERRSDVDLWRATVKKAENIRLRQGGAARRRPGTWRVGAFAGAKRGIPVTLRDQSASIIFSAGGMAVVLENGAIEYSLTGAPWSADDIDTMQVAVEESGIVITSNSFWPRVVTRSIAGTWSISLIMFDPGADGSTAQPYFRFSDSHNIALTPSAATGSITITASSAFFQAGHVGTIIRLNTREVLITAVTNSTHATGTVIQKMYPTWSLTVASSDGFTVGDSLETDTTLLHGFVASIPDSTHVVMQNSDTYSAPTTSDKLTGPTAQTTISAIAATTLAETADWDEQMISAVRGYPGACCVHKNRLIFGNFPLATSYIAASANAQPRNFDVGTALDSQAIIESIGDQPNCRIKHFVASEQLIALTDLGSYYIGEGPETPLTPTTIDFLSISSERASDVPPIFTSEGVIFVEANAYRLMLLSQTGNIRRSWDAQEMNDLAADINTAPTGLMLVDGSEIGRERYLMLTQEDGSVAVGLLRKGAEFVGWTPWTTAGSFLSLWQLKRRVYALVDRGGEVTLEYFDDAVLTDCSVSLTDTSAATALVSKSDLDLVQQYAASGRRAAYLASYDVDGGGNLVNGPSPPRVGYFHLGHRFAPELNFWPPCDPRIGFSYNDEISDVFVDLLESGLVYVGTLESDAYSPLTPADGGDDASVPAPLYSGVRSCDTLGVGKNGEAHLRIWQIEPAPLEIRAVTYWVK